MKEKKQLSLEELEQVAGGSCSLVAGLKCRICGGFISADAPDEFRCHCEENYVPGPILSFDN